MKLYNSKSVLVILLAVLCSCGKFLEESSQDLMVPKTVKDFKEFLYGEGIDNKLVLNEYVDIMSDDTKDCCPGGMLDNDSRLGMWSYFTWQPLPETGMNNSFYADNNYYNYYHKILISNVILDKLDKMTGSVAEKADLAGEAHFLRAWSYFMLVNLYGEPYENEEQAKSAMGVPVNKETGIVDNKLSRSSVADVYGIIEDDLKEAISAFKEADMEKSIFRPSLAAANLLASRVALFQKKYGDVLTYAGNVIESDVASMFSIADAGNVSFLSRQNPEIIYSTGNSNYTTYYKNDQMYKGIYLPSDDLIGLYGDGDARLGFCYVYTENRKTKEKFYLPQKWNVRSYDVYYTNFRLAEAYLNRAEAYAETGETELALADVNEVRKHRYAAGFEYIATATDETVVEVVRNERRIEFAFEGFRWFDLRRYGCPRIEHRYTNSADPTTGDLYVLEEKSAAYTLPVPSAESTNNPNIEQIARPESKPVVE